MGEKDIVSHGFMTDNEHFADAFNFAIGDGKKLIKPEDLVDVDITEEAIIDTSDGLFTSRKYRDVVKRAVVKRDNKASYVILGIENQSNIHYAMPVRNLLYDALNYSSQADKKAKNNREKAKNLSRAEFLSGFKKTDKLKPVITLTINLSNRKWDGPIRLSEILEDIDPQIKKYFNDYEMLLIDPHRIDDFGKFDSALGDLLEFIKRQNEKDFLKNKAKEKTSGWTYDVSTVIAINTFTDSKIPLDSIKEGKVDMCKATQALIDEGMEQGMKKGTSLINQLNDILIEAGRLDDLKRATKDPKFQKKLIDELITNKK